MCINIYQEELWKWRIYVLNLILVILGGVHNMITEYIYVNFLST